ncbi:MAG: hypothetical protein IKT22_02300 [Prevotella sp.]|nr:hypothetical protein [Prevotella sp.]
MMKTAKVAAVLFLSMLPLGAISMGLVACNNDDENENSEVNDKSSAQAIDLGLPSGTLWASCNVGATKPEEYGDYFAWGETKPKKEFSWENYKWYNGSNVSSEYNLTKYKDRFDEKVDNKIELDLEDDAAYVNWGRQWRMPSFDQIKELAYKCSWTWTTQNGVGGCKVVGPNGNSIFLPAAGVYEGVQLRSGKNGYYWSRSHGSITRKISAVQSIILNFYSEDPDDTDWDAQRRCIGSTIRPVCTKEAIQGIANPMKYGKNDTGYYSVNGQKLAGMPKQKGVYIFDGKKVIK